jgi:hypothetical protein
MKFAVSTTLALVALVLGLASIAPGTVSAQASSCQTNPDPVDTTDPTVIVDSPSAGDSVTSPITVSGQALVFEAVVSLALYDADGNEISTATAMAADGTQLSDFSGTIEFSVTEETPACLWVFESSAQDGSPTNVVQIELTLQPEGGSVTAPAPTLPSTGSGSDAPSSSGPNWLVAGLAFAGVAAAAAGIAYSRRRA